MSSIRKNIGFLIICMSLIWPSMALAVERTEFNFVDQGLVYEKIRQELVQNELKVMKDGIENLSMGIYEIDLNSDSINEVISLPGRTDKCDASRLCLMILYARNGDEVKRLGTFRAHDIHISDKKTQGIRDLFVFENVRNNFRYEVYSYNAVTGQYEQKDN